MTTGSPVVDAVTRMSITGNVVPVSWFQHLRLNGKPDVVGITILSDIVYWYRAREERDEDSGQVIGLVKRFRADKLQRSVRDFCTQFGLSRDQVLDALKRLSDGGVLTLEYRTVAGTPHLLFLEPVPARLAEITYQETTGGRRLQATTSTTPGDDVHDSRRRRPRLQSATNTETTTETTQREKDSPAGAGSGVSLTLLPTELLAEDAPARLLAAYHELCPNLPRVKMLTPARRDRARTALKRYPMSFWREAFVRMNASSFLCGKGTRSGGPVASFDWVFAKNPQHVENVALLLEGRYDERKPQASQRATESSLYQDFAVPPVAVGGGR